MTAKKLTKAQKEFFTVFAQNAVAGILIPVLEHQGFKPDVDVVQDVVKGLEMKSLVNAIGKSFLDRVDFKSLQKVDKFMKSEEFMKIVAASAEVNALVQDELIAVVSPLIPQEKAEFEGLPEEVEPE